MTDFSHIIESIFAENDLIGLLNKPITQKLNALIDKTINANKAYYVTSTAQSNLSFKFVDFDDDLTTSIKLPIVKDEDDSDAPIYDMCGRRLQSVPAKGIYIKGGRKYVVK